MLLHPLCFQAASPPSQDKAEAASREQKPAFGMADMMLGFARGGDSARATGTASGGSTGTLKSTSATKSSVPILPRYSMDQLQPGFRERQNTKVPDLQSMPWHLLLQWQQQERKQEVQPEQRGKGGRAFGKDDVSTHKAQTTIAPSPTFNSPTSPLPVSKIRTGNRREKK